MEIRFPRVIVLSANGYHSWGLKIFVKALPTTLLEQLYPCGSQTKFEQRGEVVLASYQFLFHMSSPKTISQT